MPRLMRLILEFASGVRVTRDEYDVDDTALAIFVPDWRGHPTDADPRPARFQQYTRFVRTTEIRDGLPVFRQSDHVLARGDIYTGPAAN